MASARARVTPSRDSDEGIGIAQDDIRIPRNNAVRFAGHMTDDRTLMTGSRSEPSFARSLFTATAVLVPTCLLWSCTFDWTVLVPPLEEPRGVATPKSTMDVDSSDVDAVAGDADTVDAPADDASSDSDAAKPCSLASPCPEGEYCRFADHYCGSGMTDGLCAAKPGHCDDAGIAPVCGCDHTVYTSQCAAEKEGADVSLQACSTTPPTAYRCGYLFCTASEFCSISGTGASATYECKTLGGCALGCLCTQALLNCAGGTCAKEGGHVVTRCP
jgi:hypothetical protein